MRFVDFTPFRSNSPNIVKLNQPMTPLSKTKGELINSPLDIMATIEKRTINANKVELISKIWI